MHLHPTSDAQGLSFRQAEHRLFPQVPTALHLKAHGLLGTRVAWHLRAELLDLTSVMLSEQSARNPGW